MDTTSLGERQELAAAIRALLDQRSPEPAVRAAMASGPGHDAALWSTLTREMGLAAMAVPERFGGAGAGWADLGVVFRELGRSLACVPFLSTVGLGAATLLASEDETACARWLPGIAAGESTATAAIFGNPDAVTARPSGGDWLLSGNVAGVLDGATAGLLLVPARTAGGVSLFAVPDPEHRRPGTIRTSDLTRRVAAVALDGAPAVLVGERGAGAEIAEAAGRLARVALAHEQIGGAAATVDMAVGYAKTRRQFGRVIGSFQAVKHRCADMLVALESAESAAWAAACAADSSAPDLPLITDIASVVCGEAYVRCASDNVQIHGGIGFTWEHPAQLHVKRSRGSAVLFGTPNERRASLANRVPTLRAPAGTP
ncbi:acyl-CoA dehydrogenase family protein [Tomitella biformata]|uniref:acyl-CoA dehydrogenase family protein n=1 Tax=Tomitella biformata TaxID=630403 RepID=UPI0004657D05|nr:acyl-CoA dehydrogenase family protein [Tomitella biformata]